MMMRHAVMLLTALSPMPALSQSVAVERAVVDACFQLAPRGDTHPDCIGVAARACHSVPGMDTTMGIGDCLMAEQAEWDEILNREYQETRKHLLDSEVPDTRLRDAQRAWITLRDADCDVAGERYGGGSLRIIAYANCQLDHTARRALDLKNMREY